MDYATRFVASAAVGGLMVLGPFGAVPARAQSARGSSVQPVGRVASFAAGSILGFVQDEKGSPVSGVVVSALGATTVFAVTDRNGRFEFGTLAPGPYLVRAHLTGYVAPSAQMVQVRASARATSAIELRHSGSAPVLAASIGAPVSEDTAAPPDEAAAAPAGADAAAAGDDDHSETAWRLRHARRGILKEVIIPAELFADNDRPDRGLIPVDLLTRAVGSPARAATSFFADTPLSGQVNLLTTGSFDSPQRLFSGDDLARNIAYARVSAPVGEQADWTVRGALTQADISAWIVAGSYSTRAPARHRYDVGMSYSMQRYDGGNPLARRDLTDGSRNAGTVYAYDSFTITPATTLGYGAAYARYDYLDSRSLLSPRVELTVTPIDKLRVSAEVSRRDLAPGAEEFLPPSDTGIWLPPQRTFSSIRPDQAFDAERTTHISLAVERDFGASTIALRAFKQNVADQLVTLFGEPLPDRPSAVLGHYVVGNVGDASAAGFSSEFRTVIAKRVHGTIAYSVANAQITPASNVRYLVFLAPSTVRSAPERIHDLSTRIETDIPETATRVLVLYRISNAFARAANISEAAARPALDGRFDVQVRQSLPFMNFSNARWEMLLAVRNFFRETVADQSVYDELLVVRPPKRLVGGVTLHF